MNLLIQHIIVQDQDGQNNICKIFIDDLDLVSGFYPYTQDSSPVIMVFMKSGLLFVESSMFSETSTRSCFCSAPVVPSFSLLWKSNESTKDNLTQMLLAIKWHYWQGGKKIHACVWRFKVASCKRASLKSTRFSKKIRSDTFLTDYIST